MSELKLTGKLHKIFPTNQISATFKKRDFVIETENQYPQLVKFELKQDKCSKIDDYKVGDEITVNFNLRGREWINKNNEVVYFVSLEAWRLEKGEQVQEQPVVEQVAETEEVSDKLPF